MQVLGHECLREVELGLHDREPVLFEHELGGLSIAEVLPLSHERRELSLENSARLCRRLPQIHMLQCGPGIGRGPPPEGWTSAGHPFEGRRRRAQTTRM